MADHRHQRRDAAALGGAGAEEHRHEAVAGEVARAADAVLDTAAHHVGGIDVAVQVGLDHAVHADAAEPAHQFRMVRHFLRAHDDALAVEGDVALERLVGGRAQRETGAGGDVQHAFAQQVEHAVLDDLGECGQAAETALGQSRQHGIGDVAHAGLQRQQGGRQAAKGDFVLQEFDQVAGDAFAGGIDGRERAVAVRPMRAHHGDDLVRIAAQGGVADAVVHVLHRDRLAVRRQRGAVVDVVHALHAGGLPVVDLHDDLAGQVQPGLVVADRRGGHQRAVLADRRDFHHRGIDGAVEAEPHVLRHVAQVDVDVVQRAVVDALACVRIALERHAQGDGVGLRECAVELGRGGGTGHQLDLERLARAMRLLDARGQRQRHRLRIA